MLKALNNPLRREALRLLHRSPEPMSATQMARAARLSGNKLSHHLKVLEEFDVVTLMAVRKVRGAKENLYVSRVSDNATVAVILADTEKDDAHARY